MTNSNSLLGRSKPREKLISGGFPDEQGVEVAHSQGLLQPPPGVRRGTALAGHQQGQVARRKPTPARQFVLGDAQLVQRRPHRVPVELHPAARGTLAPHLPCFPPPGLAPPDVLVEHQESLPRERGQGEPRWLGAAEAASACPHVRPFLLPACLAERLGTGAATRQGT